MAANTSTKKLVNELEKAVDSSKKLLKVFEDTQDVTKDVAKDLEKAFKGVDKKTSKGIAELNKLLAQTNKLTEQSEQLIKAKKDTESDLIKVEKRLSAARKDEIKEKQELEKLDSLKQKNAVQVKKEEERLLKLKEKQQKESKKTQDAYQKESALLRKMKKDLKATVIEMRRLGKSEEEVAKATKTAAKEINKLDRELRDLDKSVGDSFREIGKYENALNDLKDTASGAGAALAGVAVGFALDNLTDSITSSRKAQLELDKVQNKAKATADVIGSDLLSSVTDVLLDDEADKAFDNLMDSRRELSSLNRSMMFTFDDAEKAKLQEQIKLINIKIKSNLTELHTARELVSERKKLEENSNSEGNVKTIKNTVVALDNLSDQTLKADIANNALAVSLSLLVKEQEELRAISDDDTRSLNEAIEAKIKLTEQNKLVAETQEEIAANDLKIQTLNIGAELLAKKKITLDQALNSYI